ncbi:hypothetical protein [Ferroplasma sp.]|uniref:hypothetical protein n=1 Tax=Ferroplasma sp. TaxID=2591003 RepID=UPI00307D9B01
MIIEDYRHVSCGGDPFNFLMSSIKSIQIDMKPDDTVKIMIMDDKYPYTDKTFLSIAKFCKLTLASIERTNGEVHLTMKK